MHEVVLMPVTEPDHRHTLFGSEPDESFPIGSRIDEDPGPFDIDRIAVKDNVPGFRREESGLVLIFALPSEFQKKG
jgi:hypothetical protein